MKKGLRFTIGAKILISSLAVNVLICVIMGVTVYRYVYSSFVQSIADDTLAMAQISAGDINGNLLGLLERGSDESYANEVTRETLDEIMADADINAIYTVGMRDGELVYLSQPESEGALIGDPVEAEFAAEMSAAMSSDGYVTDYIDEADDGSPIITAYAPIQDNSGKTVGVLGIDYSAKRVTDALSDIVRVIVMIAVGLAILSAFVSILIATFITRGLKAVNNKVRGLVDGGGDLTQKLEVRSNDEVGDIADNINGLLEYIRGIVSSIYSCSTELSGSVDTALDTTVRTNDQLDGVSATMEEMSAAMEETSASLEQVQASTYQIKQDVSGMYSSVQDGTSYAGEMESRAVEMRDSAAKETQAAKDAADEMTVAMNEKMEKSKAVEKISGLTQTILDIAEETNLLSLNASIEAARAGEHGRGFAVVAGQINKLAANSAETATQIQEISDEVIAAVRDLSEESERMLDFVREKTIGGYQQLMETGEQYQQDARSILEMLKAMEENSQNIEYSMNDVSSAMDAVSQAVEESAKGVGDVASAVSEMSENMKQNKAVVGENADIAQQLDGEVGKFKF